MSDTKTIRVLLAEDQTMLRGALAALLELEPDISVVGQAANGREAQKLARELTPDVIVSDIEMPEMTGLEFAAALKESGSKSTRHHPHHLCAAWISASRARCRCARIPAEGAACE